LVRTYYVSQGRLVRDKGITRGVFLVYNEKEWRERFDRTLDRTMGTKSAIATVVLTIVCMFPLFLVVYYLPDSPARYFMFLFLLMLSIIPYYTIFRTRQVYGDLPVPSLHEQGIQESPLTFIPYGEIASVERTTIGGRKQKDRVVLNPRYQRWERGFKIKAPWFMSFELLGEDGVNELEARLRGGIGPAEPPELHLYET